MSCGCGQSHHQIIDTERVHIIMCIPSEHHKSLVPTRSHQPRPATCAGFPVHQTSLTLTHRPCEAPSAICASDPNQKNHVQHTLRPQATTFEQSCCFAQARPARDSITENPLIRVNAVNAATFTWSWKVATANTSAAHYCTVVGSLVEMTHMPLWCSLFCKPEASDALNHCYQP